MPSDGGFGKSGLGFVIQWRQEEALRPEFRIFDGLSS